jgi:pyruvate,water dikinase
MMRLMRRLVSSFTNRREAREGRVLTALKARYHGFRVLLSDNEQALRLLAEFDRQRAARDAEALAETSRKLLDTAYDLIDGLNRIGESGHLELYDLHEQLSADIQACLAEMSQQAGATPLLIRIDDPNAANHRYAGGKAASLAVLRRSGLPVPDGFIATTRACRHFLEAAGLDRLIRRSMGQVELGKSMEVAGREIAEAVLAAPLPGDLAAALESHWQALGGDRGPPVSVRSSALVEDRPGQTFAGQFHTVLNVRTKEALVQAFREVVAGNFAARPTAYRRQAGLPLADLDMAVLCQVMVAARASGVLFSVDPAAADSGRMLITAVPGLGTGAVGGELPADVFRPPRDAPLDDETAAVIAEKPYRDVADAAGGLRREEVPGDERCAPILDAEILARLVHLARSIESLRGGPQDIEWALDEERSLQILQARAAGLSAAGRQSPAIGEGGRVLIEGGVCASPGRAVGKVRRVFSPQDLRALPPRELCILVLPMSLVEAAPLLIETDGVAVELGNPADHLSCVARELGIPMVTTLTGALGALSDGQWVVLDADQGLVREAPAEAWSRLEAEGLKGPQRRRRPGGPLPPALARLAELVLPLNLTDSYGPTFSPLECRSVHDLIRFVHEMGVLAMFDLGDSALEAAGGLPRYLEGHPLHFLILDLGGGLAPGAERRAVSLERVRCEPLLAVCRGMAEPGLRWRRPPPKADLSGLLSRSLLDAGSARPLGGFNYALITRDFLNLNARVDFHFVMLDAVCGPSPSANRVYFRFKGGGTARSHRERRARLVSEILKTRGFYTDCQGDLATAMLSGMPQEQCAANLVLLGRLMGFTRLLDAAMTDDAVVERAVQAFIEGDYALERFEAEEPQA